MLTPAEHLLIFARLPEPGKTKTRLIDAFGSQRATELYRALAQHTLDMACRFASQRGCNLTTCFSGGSSSAMAAEFGGENDYREQQGDDLGSRLNHAIQQAFSRGAERVVVFGTDCHELDEQRLAQAFDALRSNSNSVEINSRDTFASCDVVLGPALDGGYYLIGMKQPQSLLFEGIEWGTNQVLDQTKLKAREAGLRCAELSSLSDVDYPEDVISMRSERAGFPRELFRVQPGRLSIVLPTLNEAGQLLQTLQAIGSPGPQLEIIVVDGGSRDRTLEIAKEFGCQTLKVARGRGAQMNAGAAVSTGETLLFLHADTRLPSEYCTGVEDCLAAGHVAGAFRLGITGQRLGMRLVEYAANLRSRWLQMPYGDQALFMRANTFFNSGGFGRLPIMEDFELVARLRRTGKIGLIRQPVATSGRRWQKHGILKTTAINQLCLLAYRLGISPQPIANFYRRQD
ncbi:MAG: TIGR04283 family arsenosugar biosynthesis glycosyltransferase [Planctomycetales bacterium]|nr:TIGR04283 family arsenosugar biosynthesis glycosyltransferase [Planctomycetales bacterium]